MCMYFKKKGLIYKMQENNLNYDKRITILETKLNEQDSQIEGIKKNEEKINDKIEFLSKNVNSIDKSLAKLQVSLDMYNNTVDKRLNELNDRFGILSVKIDKVIEDTGASSTDISENKTNTDWLKNIMFVIIGCVASYLFSLISK